MLAARLPLALALLAAAAASGLALAQPAPPQLSPLQPARRRVAGRGGAGRGGAGLPRRRPVGRAGAAAAVAVGAAALGAANAVSDAAGPSRGPISAALNLGDPNNTASRDDCVWRRGLDRDRCPDPDVFAVLYTGNAATPRREPVDTRQRDWLRRSGWDPAHENVFLVHGYGGGEDEITSNILRTAYLRAGGYNVFSVDWGALSRLPCYPAAVHNMRTVARCAARMLTFLRDSGLPSERSTCVGHSLGAHVCGLIGHFLTFRMHRIIALDPARPLVRLQNKLGPGDATVVQVMHTNAGHYGEPGRQGHADFCVNGGRLQPFCENNTRPELCSHMRSVCYLAESVSRNTARLASPCGRRCPSGLRQSSGRLSDPVYMGQHTPVSAVGSFCVANLDEPYCAQDERCCSRTAVNWPAPQEPEDGRR